MTLTSHTFNINHCGMDAEYTKTGVASISLNMTKFMFSCFLTQGKEATFFPRFAKLYPKKESLQMNGDKAN